MYCPDQAVSRAQMASFLTRALGLAPSSAQTFSDDDGNPHEADIEALAAAGITKGCGGGRFCPTAQVTRAEMATFLARALGLEPIEPVPVPTGPTVPGFGYAVSLAVPVCDASNPAVRVITTVGDWADVNDPSYQVFCVAPGDYTAAGEIQLETSGSAGAPRWIRYYDPGTDNRHPVHRSQHAVVAGLWFDNADHWVVQGLTQRGGDTNTELWSGSEHNVLDRMLVEGGRTTAQVRIRPGAHYNTVQNSVLRNPQPRADEDRVCVLLYANNNGNPVATRHTRIVNNEIYNCTDGVGLHRPSDVSIPVDYSGTIIDNNDIYITNALYSNGSGRLDPNGDYACAENAVDIKAGGTPGNHVLLSNNRMWGFRQTDDSCGGTGSWGEAVQSHMGARYTLIHNNRIWDSARGISLSDDSSSNSVIDNVIYDIHNSADTAQGFSNQDYGLKISSPYTEVYRNVLVNMTFAWGLVEGNNNDYRCNVFIDARRVQDPGDNITADYNSYYNAEQLALPGTHDLVSTRASDANHADLTFLARRWTSPQTVRIPHGVATSTSPHAGACDPNLGSRPGIGINNQPWN